MHHGVPSGNGGGEEIKKILIVVMLATVLLAGCAGTADEYTAGRTLAGGAIGAGSGALIGWAAGQA